MRLYERFADKNFHTSVATTFGIDFDSYESIALSRLRGAGCRNNLVIADGRMLSHALGGASELPQRAGTHYSVSGASAAGVFHPKLFLQFGRKGGRLIIGSANLTPSGLAGNLEIIGMLSCDEDSSGEQQLIAQAWHYAVRFADGAQQSVNDQIAWLHSRAGWLEATTPASGPVQLADGTLAGLLLSGETTGIAWRFADLIDGPVTRLIVISPYWDPQLAALSYLTELLNPEGVAVLVDPETKEFPKDAAHRIENLKLYNRGTFREGRFIHAKVIIAQTESVDHVLFGSANCTSAALGGANFAGSNAEACLYRALPAGILIEALKLGDILTDDQIIAPHDLNEPDYAEDLPLAELAAKNPGTFEGRADSLRWRSKAIENPQDCTISLLGIRGLPIACTLKPLPAGTEQDKRFQIESADQRPAFAQITFPNGTRSSPAIITWIDTLKREIRERRRSSIQNRLDELEADTEASLALLDIMNELQALEKDESPPKAPISVPKLNAHDDSNASENHTSLSYEEFIAGRRPRTSGHELSYNSLAGSDVSIVRVILNRIIGFGVEYEDQAPTEQDDDAFDLGDETEDAEGAMDAGVEFGAKIHVQEDIEEDKLIRRAQQRRATQDQLINAVKKFQEDIKGRQNANEPLKNYDLIRLRALIMILATAASPHAHKSKESKDKPSTLRVLPVEGDPNSWPVLIGRLLFSFFGGNKPAIRLLHLIKEHDQIPGDFSECWATCYWALQACINAPLSPKEQHRIEGLLKPMMKTTFLLTLPSKDEVLAEEIISVMDQMNKSYVVPLGINPLQILNGHRALVEETFKCGNAKS